MWHRVSNPRPSASKQTTRQMRSRASNRLVYQGRPPRASSRVVTRRPDFVAGCTAPLCNRAGRACSSSGRAFRTTTGETGNFSGVGYGFFAVARPLARSLPEEVAVASTAAVEWKSRSKARTPLERFAAKKSLSTRVGTACSMARSAYRSKTARRSWRRWCTT